MKTTRKALILTLIGFYLSGFLFNAAAAILQIDSCGQVCCCIQKAHHSQIPAIKATPQGCCSASPSQPCDLQSGTTAHVPQLALQNTPLTGERLFSYPGDTGHLLKPQQMQWKTNLSVLKKPIRQTVPLYLETQTLLC